MSSLHFLQKEQKWKAKNKIDNLKNGRTLHFFLLL